MIVIGSIQSDDIANDNKHTSAIDLSYTQGCNNINCISNIAPRVVAQYSIVYVV